MKLLPILLAVAVGAVALPGTSLAQGYPSKPIRLIVPYPPGGPTDFVGRAVAQKLSESLGQQVVVDNRAGAASVIGTEIAARAVPDGYTLGFGTGGGLTVAPLTIKTPYDPLKDFAPVAQLVISPQVVVAHPSVKANNMKELIALAKERPGTINYASVGTGSPNHLGGELLRFTTGIDIVHVPYKGTSPAITDLIAGQVQIMFSSMPTVLAHTKTGKLRLLATGGSRRTAAIPDTPTVAETLPGFEVVTWYGIFAPTKTPPDIIRKLNGEIVRIMRQQDIRDRFEAQGLEPQSSTPQELGEYMRREHDKWSKVIRAAGIKPQ
jgi:tripartite-type tricarboxylate transporter receptor subunit TctC